MIFADIASFKPIINYLDYTGIFGTNELFLYRLDKNKCKVCQCLFISDHAKEEICTVCKNKRIFLLNYLSHGEK